MTAKQSTRAAGEQPPGTIGNGSSPRDEEEAHAPVTAFAMKEFLPLTMLLSENQGGDQVNLAISPPLLALALTILVDDKCPWIFLFERFLESNCPSIAGSIADFLFESTGNLEYMNFPDSWWLLFVDDALNPVEEELAREYLGAVHGIIDETSRGNSTDISTHAARIFTSVHFWVQEQTKCLLWDILPRDWIECGGGFLVSAVAFHLQSSRNQGFDILETEKLDFFVRDGEPPVPVASVTSKKKQFISTYSGFKVLSIPLKVSDDRRFSMYIFLPDANDGLTALIDNVASSSDFEFNSFIPTVLVEVGELKIPRFKITFGSEKPMAWNWMSIADKFQMVDDAEVISATLLSFFSISSIFQKSSFEINENGPKAASVVSFVSDVDTVSTKQRVDFVADHPFLFMIREDHRGLPVFIGKVVDPRAGYK